MTGFSRALPFGATLVDRNRAHFRLFAPAQPSVAVDIEGAQSTWAQYTIQVPDRDKLQAGLKAQGKLDEALASLRSFGKHCARW